MKHSFKDRYVLRRAMKKDSPAIKKLVVQSRINPFGLDWHRFVIAVNSDGNLIGCGQLKVHRDGSKELASIAVCPEWQKMGVARALIDTLINGTELPIFLTCRYELHPFYEKFGFRAIDEEQEAAYFRGIIRLISVMRRTKLFPVRILVMKLDD